MRRRGILVFLVGWAALATRASSRPREAQAYEAHAPSPAPRVSLPGYPALRAYAGNETKVWVKAKPTSSEGAGIAGVFARDDADRSSADNGGTIIVGSNGKCWKRVYSGAANVQWFGARGDGSSDDTAAFRRCIAAVRDIYLPGGIYLTNFGDPAYHPDYINEIPSGTTFRGDGSRTIWKPHSASARGCIGTDSGNVGRWSEDILFANIRFEGDVVRLGLDQRAHLLYLSSVRRLRVENCTFRGMRGDGLYIGSGFGGGPNYERHNHDVRVRNCLFDGVNNANRNAISVIDVDGMRIEGCTFVRNSTKTMPGSIDFEPDESYSVIRNIDILGNRFSQCRGSGGHVVFACGRIPYDHFSNIVVRDNEFRSSNGIVIETMKVVPDAVPAASQNVMVSGNTFLGVNWALYKGVGSLRQLRFTGNKICTSFPGGGRILIGHPNIPSTWRMAGLTVANNEIRGNDAILIDCTDNLFEVTFDNNVMEGARVAAIRVGAPGSTTESIRITNNAVLGTPRYVVLHEASTKNPARNTYRNNTAPEIVTHTFQAFQTDNVGSTSNVFSAAAPPSSFPYGVSATRVMDAPVVASLPVEAGLLRTERRASDDAEQWFAPEFAGRPSGQMFFRRAVSASRWGSWVTTSSSAPPL